ncbi:MAG: four helix bundle protein [bacterium]
MTKIFDLEERTFSFANKVKLYVKALPKTITNIEIGKQLFRSAGSVGANYIEANESLSKKNFVMRVKICRKEAKESRYWLHLSEPQPADDNRKAFLIQEATEFTKIFGAILERCK